MSVWVSDFYSDASLNWQSGYNLYCDDVKLTGMRIMCKFSVLSLSHLLKSATHIPFQDSYIVNRVRQGWTGVSLAVP
jgi:hypothetical protein